MEGEDIGDGVGLGWMCEGIGMQASETYQQPIVISGEVAKWYGECEWADGKHGKRTRYERVLRCVRSLCLPAERPHRHSHAARRSSLEWLESNVIFNAPHGKPREGRETAVAHAPRSGVLNNIKKMRWYSVGRCQIDDRLCNFDPRDT